MTRIPMDGHVDTMRARILAALLDITEAEAGWAMINLWVGCHSIQKDFFADGPGIYGIEGLARWRDAGGKRGAFIEVGLDPNIRLLEREPGGIRVLDIDIDERKAERKTGVVYFIRAINGGPIKIGYSERLGARLAGLQTSHPERLVIVGHRPGTMADERALHERFAADRLEGEWFRESAELLALAKGGS